jgi:hypothetical protein
MIDRPPKPLDVPPSPRFKTRGEKKAKDQKRAMPDDFAPIMAELMKQSDRGAAIIAGSLLEEILETAIRARLRELSSDQRKALFGRMAPLSTFSAKIEIGFAIGLYAIPVYTNLNMVREARNRFAHQFETLTFEHPDIVEIVMKPDRPRLLILKDADAATPRGEFMGAFGVLSALLLGMTHFDVRLPIVSETHGELLHQMTAALKEALRMQAEKRQGHTPENTGPVQK